jgi:hypothetical protein
MGKVRWEVVRENGQEVVKEIHKKVFHKIRMSDCEDPDLMVADPIWKWQQTPAGKFVMEHAIKESPTWHRHLDPMTYGYTYLIVAEMEAKNLTEYYLKFDKVDYSVYN